KTDSDRADSGSLETLNKRESLLCRHLVDQLVGAEHTKSIPEHGSVDSESSTKMCSQSVLGNPRGRSRFLKQIILKTRLDHRPSNGAVEAVHCRDTSELSGQWF